MNYYDKFNIMLLGDEGVGKTSLLQRYINNSFSDDQRRTIGVDFFTKEKKIDDKNILIKFWDTVGNEKDSKVNTHYNIVQCICIIASISDKNSYTNIEKWISKIKEYCPIDSIVISLLFNKIDLTKERTVSEDDIMRISDKLGIHYFEASAKTGDGVDIFFDNVIKEIYESSYGKTKTEDLDEGSCNSEANCIIF